MNWKIKYTKGDLVRDAERDFDVIAHGCNCYCTMGAGIALGVKNKWPEAYAADKKSAFADKNKLGSYSVWSNDNITILNMYTQWDYKGTSVKADYDAIRSCMKLMKHNFTGKKIGLPLIGAGLAGGDWNTIKQIIFEELQGEDVTIVIWEKSKTAWELELLEEYKRINNMRKPTVYVDMDDTAVNFSKQLQLYNAKYPDYQYPQSIVGFFTSMEPMPGFMEAWGILGEYYDMRFLTRPSIYNLKSYEEKAVWVRDNMGGIDALEKLNLCPDKSIVVGDYLIDDWNIHGQPDFHGEFVRFGHQGRCKTWKEVVVYLLDKAGLTEQEIRLKMKAYD